MRVQTVDPHSSHFEPIVVLGKANSSTLGHLPRRGFEAEAGRGHLLAALDESGSLKGYLLYRVGKRRASIIHLFVPPESRLQGVARRLVSALRERVGHLEGVLSTARRNHQAHQVWPRLGFLALTERAGASAEGHPLTFWWLDQGHPAPLRVIQEFGCEGRLNAVVDADVFQEFLSPEPHNRESRAMLADWAQEILAVHVTEEMVNQLQRKGESEEDRRQRNYASQFRKAPSTTGEFLRFKNRLEGLLRHEGKNGSCGRRHLAHALAAGADLFITRDTVLARNSDRIFEALGLRVASPCAIVDQLESLVRQIHYRPRCLAGSPVRLRRVMQSEGPIVVRNFQQTGLHEKRGRLEELLLEALADRQGRSVWVLSEGESTWLAAFVERPRGPRFLEVPLLRVKSGKLASTLARQVIQHLVTKSVTEGRSAVLISDAFLSRELREALPDLGFIGRGEHWVKFNLRWIGGDGDLADSLTPVNGEFGSGGAFVNEALQAVDQLLRRSDGALLATLEERLWPAKMSGAALPNYLVPIGPAWASELFDHRLASQSLYQPRHSFNLRGEGVYFRPAPSGEIRTPARILWFVTHGNGYQGTECVRASSRLEEVAVGRPRDLYSRFLNLTLYDWANISEMIRAHPSPEMAAFRFRDTEVFDHPVAREELIGMTGLDGVQAPASIDESTFLAIYRAGTGAASPSLRVSSRSADQRKTLLR